MEESLLLIHLGRTEAEQAGLVLFAYLVSGCAFAWVLWKLSRASATPVATAKLLAVMFGAALVFRLTLLPLAPTSSSDAYRYLWEGLIQTRGVNPYSIAPDDAALSTLAETYAGVHTRINHADIPSIYPPTAQALFRLNATLFGGSLIGWKLILLAFEALFTWALWALLQTWHLPSWTLYGVLWCPLLFLETYEAGHLDVVGVTLLVLGLLAVVRRRDVPAGVAFGFAFNVKYLWPALVLLLLLAQPGRRRRGLVTTATAAGVAVLCWIPYLSGVRAAGATMRMFAAKWRFNGTVFGALEHLPGPAWLPVVIVGLLLLMLVVFVARFAGRLRWSDIWLLCGAAMLLSPVAFPWYFVWLVPGLLVRPPLWLIAWMLLVPALHVVDWRERLSGEWQAMPWLCVVVSALPGILVLTAWWRRVVEVLRERRGLVWIDDARTAQEGRCAL